MMSDLEKEMMQFGLDDEQLKLVRQFMLDFKRYPETLLYTLNDQQRSVALSLGATAWRDFTCDLRRALYEESSIAVMSEQCGWVTTGASDWEWQSQVLLDIYTDIRSKISGKSKALFAYKVHPKYSTKHIMFSKYSELEIFEHAVNQNTRIRSRANYFSDIKSANSKVYAL